MSTQAVLDHLVLAASSLEAGVAWCEQTLGVAPRAGGRHALMGTHNRVFTIASAAFPRAYFEIIAIDPHAPPPGRTRWFDLDAAALQASLAHGPQLAAWVARVSDLDAALATLAAQGIDAGRAAAASRMTPQGELRWRIALRDDGARLFGGALPTLIEWGPRHPCDDLPASGVTLASLALRAPDASPARRALQSLGFTQLAADAGASAIAVELDTARGRVRLSSASRSGADDATARP